MTATKSQDQRRKYAELRQAMVLAGFQVIGGHGKGGFWVRDIDGNKVGWTNENSFITYAAASKRFGS